MTARTGFDVPAMAHAQRLLDVYGPLLTPRQRDACRLHLDEDLSFAEVADEFGCTRSAVHDLVRRGLAQLEECEHRLGFVSELARRDGVERRLRAQLQALQGNRHV